MKDYVGGRTINNISQISLNVVDECISSHGTSYYAVLISEKRLEMVSQENRLVVF